MKRGIVFIRGISMYGNNNFTKDQLWNCIKKCNAEKMRMSAMYGNDNVIFEKSDDIQYATVGSAIEKTLSKHFQQSFLVTARSWNTVVQLIHKYEEKQ